MKSKKKGMIQFIHRHSKNALSLFTITLFLFSSFLILNQTAEAQLVCPQSAIQQITDEPSGDSDDAVISADGRWIAFESQANIGGGNPSGQNEVFLFDTTNGIITQITQDIPGSSSEPSINRDGTRVAFPSSSNIGGGNPDMNREVFLFDRSTGIFTQITDEPPPAVSNSPSINADGTRIAFRSDGNINNGNPDLNFEIYVFNTVSGVITQVTFTAGGGSSAPSINADGTHIAFQSASNINGGNPEGNTEIYVFDTVTGIITQITFTTVGNSSLPSINADGTRIAFQSASNINGGNPEGNEEIYLFDQATGIFTQITDDPVRLSRDASINADGTHVAFSSSADINGGNPDGNAEIYVFDTLTGIITQITDEPSGLSRDPSIDTIGTRIAFDSDADINGGNPDGNEEIYLAICLDPMTARNIPTLSEWGLIAMAGVLGIAAFLALRRRKSAA